jgi:magnesium chelatase family protein
LLDRIDIQIEIPAVPQEELMHPTLSGEQSSAVQRRTEAAYQKQTTRQGKANSRLMVKEMDEHCKPDSLGENLLKQAISRLNLSARAYHRVLRVARTIADLSEKDDINRNHIAEAIQYRRLGASQF